LVARVNTVAFQGIDVLPIDVQVQMTGGMPADIAGERDRTAGRSK